MHSPISDLGYRGPDSPQYPISVWDAPPGTHPLRDPYQWPNVGRGKGAEGQRGQRALGAQGIKKIEEQRPNGGNWRYHGATAKSARSQTASSLESLANDCRRRWYWVSCVFLAYCLLCRCCLLLIVLWNTLLSLLFVALCCYLLLFIMVCSFIWFSFICSFLIVVS